MHHAPILAVVKVVAAAVVAAHLAAASASTAAHASCPALVAHDGYTGPARVPGRGPVPSDSVAALSYAARIGATAVKFDERWSRDNVPVVIHNWTVDATTGHLVHGRVVRYRGAVGRYRAAALTRMHLLTATGTYTSRLLPTAKAMLKAAAAADLASVIIEVKTPVMTSREARSLRAAVTAAHVAAITSVQTFFTQNVTFLRAAWPSLRIAFLERSPALPPAGTDSVVLRGSSVSASSVAKLRRHGLFVGAYTSTGAGVPDSAVSWNTERADGIQQVFTNDARGYRAWQAIKGCK